MEYKKTAVDFFSAAVILFDFCWAAIVSPVLPPAGPLLAAKKWAEKPPGRPRSPVICLIGRHQI